MKVNVYSSWFGWVSTETVIYKPSIVSSSFYVCLKRNALDTVVTLLPFNSAIWETTVGACGLCKLYRPLDNLECSQGVQTSYFVTHNYFVVCQAEDVVNSKPSGIRDHAMLHRCQHSVNHRSVSHIPRKVKGQPELPKVKRKGWGVSCS